MKTNFELDDDWPLGKPFNVLDMIIVAASVYAKNGKCYPKNFSHECT